VRVKLDFLKFVIRNVSFACGCVAAAFMLVDSKSLAADLPVKVPPLYEYDWTGFYVGGSIGVATGRSNWTANALSGAAPPAAGSFSLYRSPDAFTEGGSTLEGVQGGYNYMFANRMMFGFEAEATFPTFPDLSGLTTGGISSFISPTLGPSTFSETMLWSGSLRGRIG